MVQSSECWSDSASCPFFRTLVKLYEDRCLNERMLPLFLVRCGAAQSSSVFMSQHVLYGGIDIYVTYFFVWIPIPSSSLKSTAIALATWLFRKSFLHHHLRLRLRLCNSNRNKSKRVYVILIVIAAISIFCKQLLIIQFSFSFCSFNATC